MELDASGRCVVVLGAVTDMVITDMGEFYHGHYRPYKEIMKTLPCDAAIEFHNTCDELLEAVAGGAVDIAASRSACFLRAREQLDAEPVVSFGANNSFMHRAVILVRKDSGIEKFEDLKGKKFSTIKSDSFEYNVFPRYLLKSRIGGKSTDFFEDVVMCPTIFSSIYAVIYGEADAVAVDEEYLNIEVVGQKLRPIEYSFDIPYPLVYSFPGKDDRVRAVTIGFMQALLDMPEDKQYLANYFRMKPSLLWVENSDFDAFAQEMKQLGLLHFAEKEIDVTAQAK